VSVVVAVALYWLINRSRLRQDASRGRLTMLPPPFTWASTLIAPTASRSHRHRHYCHRRRLVATYNPFQPYIGLDFVIIMYRGRGVLGGNGQHSRRVLGGMTIGLVNSSPRSCCPTSLQNATIFVSSC